MAGVSEGADPAAGARASCAWLAAGGESAEGVGAADGRAAAGGGSTAGADGDATGEACGVAPVGADIGAEGTAGTLLAPRAREPGVGVTACAGVRRATRLAAGSVSEVSSAISIHEPTNPVATAAPAYKTRTLSDRPRLDRRRGYPSVASTRSARLVRRCSPSKSTLAADRRRRASRIRLTAAVSMRRSRESHPARRPGAHRSRRRP
jgi:hypothetical protein